MIIDCDCFYLCMYAAGGPPGGATRSRDALGNGFAAANPIEN